MNVYRDLNSSLSVSRSRMQYRKIQLPYNKKLLRTTLRTNHLLPFPHPIYGSSHRGKNKRLQRSPCLRTTGHATRSGTIGQNAGVMRVVVPDMYHDVHLIRVRVIIFRSSRSDLRKWMERVGVLLWTGEGRGDGCRDLDDCRW
jgi:hypothetical protein